MSDKHISAEIVGVAVIGFIIGFFVANAFVVPGIPSKLSKTITENKTLKQEKRKLESQVDELENGFDRLMVSAKESLSKKNLPEAKRIMVLIHDKHPEKIHDKTYTGLLSQLNIAEKEDQKEKEQKRQLEAMRLKKALASMTKQKDDVENITWYYDKSTPQYKDNFYLYIGKQVEHSWLRWKTQITGSDWVFFTRMIIVVDGTRYVKNFDYDEVKRDNTGGDVWEWIDIEPSDPDITMMKKIIGSKKTIVRYQGDQYHYDRIITKQEKVAIKNVLDAYKQLQ